MCTAGEENSETNRAKKAAAKFLNSHPKPTDAEIAAAAVESAKARADCRLAVGTRPTRSSCQPATGSKPPSLPWPLSIGPEMVLALFAAAKLYPGRAFLSPSENDRINLERSQRFPDAEDNLARYTTRKSLLFNWSTNKYGFSPKELRLLCSQRNLEPPVAAATPCADPWAMATTDFCVTALLRWIELNRTRGTGGSGRAQ